ncbi:MAG TPA: hypothetical protein VN375_15205 [Vicinamibacteria bacterium]|nr:hypothetical protein [Vicinamibacteria bacterium]
MIRLLAILFRFLMALLLVRLGLRALSSWLGPRTSPGPGQPAPPPEDLVRDRICNTFLPRSRAVRAVVGGHEEHFCSTACRDRALLGVSQAS